MLKFRFKRDRDNFKITFIFKKFKYNFKLLKGLFPIILRALFLFWSLFNEVFLLLNINIFLRNWKPYLKQYLKNKTILLDLLISRTYILYIVLLGLFGILLGFLLGIYRRQNNNKYDIYDIYGFVLVILLILLRMLYINELNYVSFKPNNVDQFSKFSLKTMEQIPPRLSILRLKKPDEISLPFLIIEDPFFFIETEILWENSKNYKFELFKLYQNINKKIKS